MGRQAELDVVGPVEVRLMDVELVLGGRTLEVALGERGALVRSNRLFAEKDDPALEALAAQRLGCFGSGEAGTDHEEPSGVAGHGLLHKKLNQQVKPTVTAASTCVAEPGPRSVDQTGPPIPLQPQQGAGVHHPDVRCGESLRSGDLGPIDHPEPRAVGLSTQKLHPHSGIVSGARRRQGKVLEIDRR